MKTPSACLAVALLFVICSKTRGDVSLTVRPERFEIVAGSQKVVFAKDEVGRFVLTTHVHSGNSWWPVTVPLFTALLALGLIFMIFRTHKELWRIDMEAKRASQKGPEDS